MLLYHDLAEGQTSKRPRGEEKFSSSTTPWESPTARLYNSQVELLRSMPWIPPTQSMDHSHPRVITGDVMDRKNKSPFCAAPPATHPPGPRWRPPLAGGACGVPGRGGSPLERCTARRSTAPRGLARRLGMGEGRIAARGEDKGEECTREANVACGTSRVLKVSLRGAKRRSGRPRSG